MKIMAADTILLLDAGNSRIKWGVAQDGDISVGEPLPSQALLSRELLDRCWAQMDRPAVVALASVAGKQVDDTLCAWVSDHWRRDVCRITACKRTAGVVNGYQNPEQLGVDRWLAMLAARSLVPSDSVCVVDCGTAITLDVLDVDGQHRGGVIAPGLTMMKQALARGTDRLTVIDQADYQNLGTTTAAAIATGVMGAALGLIEHFMQKYGMNSTLLLTGGDAPRIATALSLPHRQEPHLVLKGLLIAASDYS